MPTFEKCSFGSAIRSAVGLFTFATIAVGAQACGSSSEDNAGSGGSAASIADPPKADGALSGVCKQVFTQIFAETETSTQMEQGKIAKTDFDAAVKFALGKWVTHQQDPSVPLTRNRRDSALDYKAVYECTNPTAPWSPRKGFPAGQDAIKGTACVLEVTAANGEKQNAIAVALDYPSELSGATDFGNVGTPVYFFSTQKGLLAGAGFQLTGDIGGYFGMRKLGFSNLSVSVDAPDGASRDDDGVRLPCTPVKK